MSLECTCKAPKLAYPNAITRYTSGIHLHRRLTHLVWPSDACQRVFRQQRSVVPEAAFLTAIMARWRVRRAPYRAQMCELTVILSIVVFYTCYLRDPRKFLIAYAWLKNYRSILKCAVCAFQTTITMKISRCTLSTFFFFILQSRNHHFYMKNDGGNV